MPINTLDHVIARRRAYGDLNVADSLKRLAAHAHAWTANARRRWVSAFLLGGLGLLGRHASSLL